MLKDGIKLEGTLGYASLSAIEARPTAELMARTYASLVSSRGKLPVMDTATMTAINAAASWMASPQGRGLIVSGMVGCGKTLMARTIKRVFDHANGSALRSKGATMSMVSAEELCRLSEDDTAIYREIVDSPYLIIDDLGSEPSETSHYGVKRTPLRSALERRYDRRLLTVVTTNLTSAELGDRYGARMGDRWREHYQWLAFGGLSKRGGASHNPTEAEPDRPQGPRISLDEFLAQAAAQGRCNPLPPGGVSAMTSEQFRSLVLNWQ